MRMLVTTALLAMTLSIAPTAAAQAPVTSADLTRLEAAVVEIQQEVQVLSDTDPTLAVEVDRSLTELDDEVTYLQVKLRREGSVTREEYASLRDRLETLRVRATGGTPAAAPAATDARGGGLVRVGTEFDVRLQDSLSSATATVEQRFEATTAIDYTVDDRVLIPAGSLVRGFVSSVSPAGRIDRRGSLTLSFDEIRVDQTTYRLRASVTQALDSSRAEDVTRIGTMAAVSGIIGGLLGGGKGALIGVLVGGGGTIAATDGADVTLPLGTVLRIRLDQPLEIAPPAS